MRAVILAGGQGMRLRPYTTVLPKPLVPVGDRPILELMIRQLAQEEFTRIDLSVGHLGGLIKAYFEGVALPEGIDLHYWWEDEPLGTAGALTMIEGLEGSFLVMNGDVLTTLRFGDLLRYHQAHDAALTIAAHRKDVKVDLGVIQSEKRKVTGYVEKPTMRYDVSMGIYAYDERALQYIPKGRFDFPDVVKALLAAGERVATYPDSGTWYDIGTITEHERASAEIASNPNLFADD
ncbi:MAG: sugar phosphate nucleotidyltransferase [Solirubrobacterales bacterium]